MSNSGYHMNPAISNAFSRNEFPSGMNRDVAPAKSRRTINIPPADFAPVRDLPEGFLNFLLPLHRAFTPRQRVLIGRREAALEAAHRGRLPNYLPSSEATLSAWKIELPAWCRDQRNQMTGPADEADLVVKMLNSGAPGVMLDLEDSLADSLPHRLQGITNILAALRGKLSYFDRKRNSTVSIKPSPVVTFVRPRGLHLHQAGVVEGDLVAGPLFDLAMVVYQLDPAELKHPLSIYIPKSESAEEALWWRDLFRELARAKGMPSNWIKCMALVEAHPLPYEMEEFAFHLRDHILGLNLGRWDYMASLIHFTLHDPTWVFPDRNTIPHDVPFFQNLRALMVENCHKHGMLAIGGMTALYPSRDNPELNDRALAVLEKDKKNEAGCLMDGAWTGHPDQNEIAVNQFPAPNQLQARPANFVPHPELRPLPAGIGKLTLAGTRAAVRTVIRYRQGVLSGKGASLLDGYMEDLATDRIYRLLIAQRVKHRISALDEEGRPVVHTAELITQIFDEELARIRRELPAETPAAVAERFDQARTVSERMIRDQEFTTA
jgi:malate synthase